ncbi:MAG: alpha-galactosidase [Victivallaceae bacterium]|nr:alpha-galactosidase [Victivallaceae bacterium]
MDNIFTVSTKNIQWSFRTVKGEKLEQSGFAIGEGTATAPSDAVQAYPRYLYSLDPSLRIIQADGSHNCMPVFDEMTTVPVRDGVVSHVFHLVDPAYPVKVRLIVTAFFESDVMTSQLEIENNGNAKITLMNRDAVCLTLAAPPESCITTFQGGWGREMTGVCEDAIPFGVLKHQTHWMIRTTWPDWPGCFIALGGHAGEEHGRVFGAALAWPGAWQYKTGRLPWDNDRIFFSAGVQDDPSELAAGAVYRSPEVVMTGSDKGVGQASRNFHKFALGGGIYNPQAPRRVVLNSWEGVYFTFDEAKLISMMDGAAELGAEMFVLDDGWFGNGEFQRNHDRAGLGDWEVNTEKLPGGLEKLIAEAHKRGLEFGLWVEPEMVNPGSRLFTEHPDWAMAIPNRDRIAMRNQYVLDLSRPEVEEYIYNAVSSILAAHPGIHYIKWDHNCESHNLGSAALGSNQGALSELHNSAYLRIMAKLRSEFPNVTFQLCSSGGGRAEFGAMRYHEEFWGSDETNGLKRIAIQWGFSHFFPAEAIASHIGRYGDGDFKLRCDVAMTARLGVELSPDAITAESRNVVAKGIAEYKKLRKFLHSAELYRGRSPHSSEVTELTFVAGDKHEAVLFAFKRNCEARTEKIHASGLDPELKYRVSEVNADADERFSAGVFTGCELMSGGLEIKFPARFASAVAHLTVEK